MSRNEQKVQFTAIKNKFQMASTESHFCESYYQLVKDKSVTLRFLTEHDNAFVLLLSRMSPWKTIYLFPL